MEPVIYGFVSACTNPTFKGGNRDRSSLQAMKHNPQTQALDAGVSSEPQRGGAGTSPHALHLRKPSELPPRLSMQLPASTTSVRGGHLCQQRKYFQPGTLSGTRWSLREPHKRVFWAWGGWHGYWLAAEWCCGLRSRPWHSA